MKVKRCKCDYIYHFEEFSNQSHSELKHLQFADKVAVAKVYCAQRKSKDVCKMYQV